MAKGKTDPFANMAVVDGGPIKEGTASGDAVTLTIPALADYGPVHKVFKELESWRKGEGCTAIKDALFEYIVPEGVTNGKTPKNPKAIDGNDVCVATISLTQRDDRTVIPPDVEERFTDLNIRLGRKVHAPGTMRVVPEVWNNQGGKKLLAKIIEVAAHDGEVKAMLKGQGIADVGDLFQIQTESAYTTVGQHTINDIFLRAREARKEQTETGIIENRAPWDDAMIRELLEVVAYVNITPRQVYLELPDAFVATRKKICPSPEDLEEARKLAEASKPQKRSGKPAIVADPVAEAIAAVGKMPLGNHTKIKIETGPARARR